MRVIRALALALVAGVCPLAGPASPAAAGEVVVYSSREAPFIEPLLRVFEGLTGHRVTFVHAADLGARLREEGAGGKADLLIANEFSQLVQLKRQGATRAVALQALSDRIPDVYRDGENHWFGLTRRARVIVVSPRVADKAASLARYEDLADPAWRGRVCVRSGKHPYNVALVASLLAQAGAEETERWLSRLKGNLARKPSGGDRDQIVSVHKGDCDVALVNSYYIPAMLKSDQPAMRDAAQGVRVLLPNAGDRGTHVTISGMALAAGSRNVAVATLLMDFLTSPPAVRIFSLDNEEYPVLEDQRPSERLEKWGSLEPENVALDQLASLLPQAAALIDQVRFDDGPTN